MRRRTPAHIEAMGHFERGLATLPGLPRDGTGTTRDQLQFARGLSILTTEAFGADEVQNLRRAHELAEREGSG